MSSNGSANVKHSQAMSDEIITALSTVCGASIFLLELFKKKSTKHLLSLLRNERGILASMGFNNMMSLELSPFMLSQLSNTVYHRANLTDRFAKRACVWRVIHYCIAESRQ